MSKKAPVVIGLGILGIGFAYAVSKRVKPCIDMEPGSYYYLIYTGKAKPFIPALGDCGGYDVIYSIDVWSELYHDFLAPLDPMHDILEPGSICRIMVQQPCKLCGFNPGMQPPVGLGLLT